MLKRPPIANLQNVVCHPIEHPTHIQTSMTLPTRPHAIFSTLQGTQNPETKPTLQRAKNANAQPTHPGGRIAMIEPKDNFKIYAAFFE